MTIEIYDANNVLRRATEKFGMPSAVPMGFRQRYEFLMAKPAGTQIWVWDGKEHNKRRQAILPEYKANRKPMAEDIFAQIRLFRQVLRHSHTIEVCVHGWEADDVIGTLVKRFNAKGVLPKVHTNDMDYGQIAHMCQLIGVNLKGVPPAWVPLFKAMVGDPSDNIPGIPGFGPKRWIELEPHWAQVQRAIELKAVAGFQGLPFKPAVAAWLSSEDNVDKLHAMLRVTRFMDVPEDEIAGAWLPGIPDPMKAHKLMAEFFL